MLCIGFYARLLGRCDDVSSTTTPARRRLLRKYIVLFALVVCTVLLGNGLTEAWFIYREQTTLLIRTQIEQANAAAAKISQFVKDVESELGWANQLPWSVGTMEQRHFDVFRLLRQVPAIRELILIDSKGRERLRVSNLDQDVTDSQIDLSSDPRFTEAMAHKVYFGPVDFRRDSVPYMTIALAGPQRSYGVVVADVNLRFIWDVISKIKVGDTGRAFVVDGNGRLIADPDISLVLRNTDLSGLNQVSAAKMTPNTEDPVRRTILAKNIEGQRVFSTFSPIAPLGWQVFVELPTHEAYTPLYASLFRTGLLLIIGVVLAFFAGLLLARRMVVPIRALQDGAARIGSGDLGYRVEVRTGDELEMLGDQFNLMSTELLKSKAREERLGRLRRFLAPQVAEVIVSSGNDELLESHRREVSVVICDMRGFTAFSETAPGEVMAVLGEYHTALGRVIHKFEATVERFTGDGLLAFFNDPLPCANPQERAVRMAVEMQVVIRNLSAKWRAAGHEIGFGIGITYGEATMGRIGFEGRLEYSVIGSVVNLASRLCSIAEDGQILVDSNVHAAVAPLVTSDRLGEVQIKGFRSPVPVYNVRGLKD
jgi:adenylate cyclase